jgi:hypothetical protein
MKQVEAYNIMRTFEMEMEEDFVDQNEMIVKPGCLMFWMLGKGYISGDDIDKFAEHNDLINLQTVLYEEDFSLMKGLCHGSLIVCLKCLEILSEIMCSCRKYQERLISVAEEHLGGSIDDFSEEFESIKAKSLGGILDGSIRD